MIGCSPSRSKPIKASLICNYYHHLIVTLIIEKRRKTHVVDAVMTGHLVINVGTIRQYRAKSSMERKCNSLHKRPRLILIPTPSQNEE